MKKAQKSKTQKKTKKKNRIPLVQWAQEHNYPYDRALFEAQNGILGIKLATDKDKIIWVETNKISLKEWAKLNSFTYDQVIKWYQNGILPVKVVRDKYNLWVTGEEIIRAVKLSLQFATQYKQERVKYLLEAYRPGTNFYIKSLWKTTGKLDAATLSRLNHTRLTERYKSQSLKQALEIVVNTKKSAQALKKTVSCPFFQGGAKLDAKVIKLEKSRIKLFDWILTLSTLKREHRIQIPLKSTQVLNKWLSQPGAKLVQGGLLTEEFLIVFVKIPTATYKEVGEIESLDLGMNKLAVDHLNNWYGVEPSSDNPLELDPIWRKILDKVRRRKPGSRGKKRAMAHRENYLNYVLRRMPWEKWRFLGIEDLDGIKNGKKNSTKQQRIVRTSWCQRRVRDRIIHIAQENRVFLVHYNPVNTSRRCPLLSGGCGKVSKANRQGEIFKCQFCGYQDDADHVGALNGFTETCRLLGSLESPGTNKGGASGQI